MKLREGLSRDLSLCVLAAAAASALGAAAQPSPSAAPAGDHHLALTNGGGQAISAIYDATAGSLDFSDDLLGRQVASVGRTVHVTIKDPMGTCVFDLQFLLADGTALTRKGVNLCQTAAYTVTK